MVSDPSDYESPLDDLEGAPPWVCPFCLLDQLCCRLLAVSRALLAAPWDSLGLAPLQPQLSQEELVWLVSAFSKPLPLEVVGNHFAGEDDAGKHSRTQM